MIRRLSFALLLAVVPVLAGCGGGVTKGGNKDLDRPIPTPPTRR